MRGREEKSHVGIMGKVGINGMINVPTSGNCNVLIRGGKDAKLILKNCVNNIFYITLYRYNSNNFILIF